MGTLYTNWPDDLRPENSPVYTYDELAMPFEPQVVWAWLIRAELWPKWYPYWSEVKFLSEAGPDLKEATVFSLKTSVIRIKTVVKDFAPFQRLAWKGGAFGTQGYHSWVIEPVTEGCRVITEETQRGPLPYIFRFTNEGIIHRRHRVWLIRLEEMCNKGLPDEVTL